MRKTLFIATALFTTAAVHAQKDKQKETIEGNGKMITREVPVSSFDAIKASGVYELTLTQGSKEAVRIEADENLQELFNVRNEGSKLVVEMKSKENKELNVKNKLKVSVTFKQLKELEVNTVGAVKSDAALTFSDLELNNRSVGTIDLNFSAASLKLTNSGVGNVKLSGKAEKAVVKNSGVGHLEAGDFVVQTMNIDNSGVGGAVVNAVKELKVSDNMLGKVKNKGTAPMKKSKVEI